MNVADAIKELRQYPMDARVDVLKVSVRLGGATSKLDYSLARNRRLGLEDSQ